MKKNITSLMTAALLVFLLAGTASSAQKKEYKNIRTIGNKGKDSTAFTRTQITPSKGDIAAGVNYPGLGFRYFVDDDVSLEVKTQLEKDIFVGGLRGYGYIGRESNILFFTGLEADYTSFKGEVSEGAGIALGIFVGGEYFFDRQWSFQADFGPAYLWLSDSKTAVSVSGLEYVVNFGINLYFGR